MSRKTKTAKIAPSVIASDLTTIGNTVSSFNSEIIDFIHMDVMDGNFVPNLTFGPAFIANMKRHTEIPLDVHLMIESPEKSIDDYIKTDPWSLTIHYEATKFPVRVLNPVSEAGILPGISLNPSTPVEMIFDILPYIKMVLIMSVDPGFGGQSFMEISLNKISTLRQFADTNGFEDLLIEVDGGINSTNISSVMNAGADIIVAGSAVFKNGAVNENVKLLKESSNK